ncbi:DUF7211 domain-containing protein [Dialister hominis]|uniref:DUF7211 domain-containing protein n=1 Tax=Dialister hominis TaxID=2582419 RepID=UPI003FEF137B
MAEYYGIHYDSVIEHHGIKGQKWGVRRYQNPDGTLTPLGRKKLGRLERKVTKLGDTVKQSRSRYMTLAKKKKNGTATSKELREYAALSSALRKSSKKLKKVSSEFDSKKKMLEESKPVEKSIDEVIKSGTKKEVLARGNEMTVAQLQESFQRLNLKAQIDKLDTDRVTKGEKFAKKLAKTAGTISSVYDSVEKITKVTNAIGLTDIKLGQKKNDGVSKFINTASASELWKMRSKLTPDQKKQAVERLKAEKVIKGYAKEQKQEEDEIAEKLAEEAKREQEKKKR